MKTKTITTWISAVAIAGLLVGAGAILAVPGSGEALERSAQGPQYRGHPGAWGPQGPGGAMHFGRIFRQLDLTEQQREAIQESFVSAREAHRDVRERLSEARNLLHEAVLRGEDESFLRQLAQAVGDVETEVALAQARHFADIVALLEPEQRSKLEELYTEMESRREERQEQFRERRREHQLQ